jgi:hypothetical protein
MGLSIGIKVTRSTHRIGRRTITLFMNMKTMFGIWPESTDPSGHHHIATLPYKLHITFHI